MPKPGRIKPPMAHDNGWWWEQAANGVLAIQRCKKCQTLRHPPRPMCSECRSLEWDFVAAGGKGTVTSYTTLYHPQFPGYEYPLIIVLVDLEEGTRITAVSDRLHSRGRRVRDAGHGVHPRGRGRLPDPDVPAGGEGE
jgi:uncharacterized OB-fold protein